MLLYVTCNLLISYPVNNLGRLKDANKHLIFVFCFLLSLYCQNTLLSLIMLLTTSCNAFIHEFSSDGIWVINRASFCLHLGRRKKQKLWHKPYESLVCSVILLRFFYKFFFFFNPLPYSFGGQRSGSTTNDNTVASPVWVSGLRTLQQYRQQLWGQLLLVKMSILTASLS